MEDDDSSLRIAELGFKPQKESVYKRCLPYAADIDRQALKELEIIKTNLVRYLLAGNVKPGFIMWTIRFEQYIKLHGLMFSKEDHLKFIKIYLEVLTIERQEMVVVMKWCCILCTLLKKRSLLSRDDLQIDWRPIYNIYVYANSNFDKFKSQYLLRQSIIGLTKLSKIYFPASATQEILDEFKPYLCPFDEHATSEYIDLLEMFLPVCVKSEEVSISYDLWFTEFMQFWNSCLNDNSWEGTMMNLICKLTTCNVGYINFEPYMSVMYARIARSCKLPVNYKNTVSPKDHVLPSESIALWIVNTLKSETSFEYLEKLMQMIRSFLYNANQGRWTSKLKVLLDRLSLHFVNRVYFERLRPKTWEREIPEEFKVSESDIDRFVMALRPCLEVAMYSRSISSDISATFQHLSSIRPNLIIPMVVENMYASLDILTQPHRLISSMTAMMAVSRNMVDGAKLNYPEGPTHVIPLLMAVLPGIDTNDYVKCFQTFQFIVHFVSMIPIVNSSDAAMHYDDLTEEEHIICEATAGFEDFIVQFIDKVCVWVESCSLSFIRPEQQSGEVLNVRGELEIVSEHSLTSLFAVILRQCSPQIFAAALKKIMNFIMNNILEVDVAGRLIAVICGSFCRVNPQESLKLFVPYLCDKIESLLDEHPNAFKEEHLDGEILYNMLILSEVVDGRNEILHYVDRLMNILNRTLYFTCIQANKISNRILAFMLYTLVHYQPQERRSTEKPFSMHVKDFLPIREWGNSLRSKDLTVEWYTPDEKEIDTVQRLVSTYLIPELDKMNQYCCGKLELSRKQLRSSLLIINATMAATTVLPMWDEDPIQLIPTVDPFKEYEAFELKIHEVKMPDGNNIRKAIADTLHKVQQRLLEVDEGDTKSLYVIISLYGSLLTKIPFLVDTEQSVKTLGLLKKVGKNRVLDRRRQLRQLLIERAAIEQQMRIGGSACAFSNTHKQILYDLFQLSTCQYRNVRVASQPKLMALVNTVNNCYTLLTDKFKEILQMNTIENHDKFKGCLYILCGLKPSMLLRQDWQFASEIWPLIVCSMPSEKISIVNLITSIFNIVSTNIQIPMIKFELPNQKFEKLCELCNDFPGGTEYSSEKYNEVSQKLKAESETREKYYNKCMDSLLQACENSDLHWRYHQLAMIFLKDIVHLDVKYSPSVVKYILQSLNSDTLSVRKIAVKFLGAILIQNKPKFKKVKIDPMKFSNCNNESNKVFGYTTHNEWLLYNNNNLPRDSESWDQLRYLHHPTLCYYEMPKTLEVYASTENQCVLGDNLEKMSGQQKELFNFFTDEKNISKLISYMSLEEKKGADKFNYSRATIFNYLSKLFEDKILNAFAPHLENLIVAKQESHQRCAAEIICGLIKGSKHWSYEKTQKLWGIVIPLLRQVFQNILSETVYDWALCLKSAVVSRDSRRYYWLLEFLLEDPLSESTSLKAAMKLHILNVVINLQPWRNSEPFHRLTNYLKNHMYHPYHIVRNKVSLSLKILFNKDYIPPGGNLGRNPKLSEFLEEYMPTLKWLYENTTNKIDNNICDKSSEVQNSKRKEALKMFKIISCFITSSLVCAWTFFTPVEYYRILPITWVLQSNDIDEEMKPMCTSQLAVMAKMIVIEENLPEVLTIIDSVIACPLWSARSTLTEFLTTFVFHNFALLSSRQEWIAKIQSVAMILLEDPQLEVRENACKLLSGLLHCKFLPSQTELLADFKVKSKTKLRKTKTANGAGSISNESLVRRHAGVLGLCAFISSTPYDIPPFLPDIFGILGPHLSDPQPIPSTIRKTLCEFKRTHQDNWEVHKMQFTEEQLYVFRDLTVPPSYYV